MEHAGVALRAVATIIDAVSLTVMINRVSVTF